MNKSLPKSENLRRFIHLYKHAASIECAKMNNEESITNTKKIQIRCKKCSRVWWYSGLNPYYATCTFCKTSLNISKNKVQDDYLVPASNQPADSIRREVIDR